MSSFSVPIAIAASPEGPFETLDAVVDTGAFYTWAPRSVLERLGVRPTDRQQFGLADGSLIEREIGDVIVRIDGRIRHTICVFGDEGTEPLLGVVTLEEFALAADLVNHRLLPMPKLPMLALSEFPLPCGGRGLG